VLGNVAPDLKDIALGERRESISAHFSDARTRRQWSFIS
jgi:hypothetical protein